MKIGKKMLVGIITAALLVGSAIPTFAAISATKNVAAVGDSAGKFEVQADIESTPSFKQLEQSAPEVAEVIKEVSSGTVTVADVVTKLEATLGSITDETAKASLEKVIEEIKGTEFATGFFDLTPTAEAEKNAEGKYVVSIAAPFLTDSVTDVKLLHYSTTRNLWELITPSNIDKENKTLTAEFEDFSPVAVLVNEDAVSAGAAATTGSENASNSYTTETSNTAASPKTGDSANLALWIAVAVVAIGAGVTVVISRKKRSM